MEHAALNSVAVLTGDVIASTALVERTKLPHILRAAFAGAARLPDALERDFEIYRGDSFQGVVRAEHALRVALTIRARLRSERTDERARGARLDARIAIGLGRIEDPVARVIESDGEAFQRSGRALDEMGTDARAPRLRIDGPAVNANLHVTVQLLDSIVNRWSSAASEAMFLALTEESLTQVQWAERLGISQPAVSQRLRIARKASVDELIELYVRTLSTRAPS